MGLKPTEGTVSAVLAGGASYAVECADLLDFLRQLPDSCVDLVVGSPPYAEKLARYPGLPPVKMSAQAWVEWMLEVTAEAVRVTKQDVVWVADGARKDGCYQPACEGLVWEWVKRGGVADRPCIWTKNSPPGHYSWFIHSHEVCMCFRKQGGERGYFDWEAVAEPPLYDNGGAFRQRNSKGARRTGSAYPKSKLARPRDVFRVTVGGGQMGHPLATQNEAPYPEGVPERFVKTLCPPGGIVLDPFLGSGTTLAIALKLGRRGLGCDRRESQLELTRQRLSTLDIEMPAA